MQFGELPLYLIPLLRQLILDVEPSAVVSLEDVATWLALRGRL